MGYFIVNSFMGWLLVIALLGWMTYMSVHSLLGEIRRGKKSGKKKTANIVIESVAGALLATAVAVIMGTRVIPRGIAFVEYKQKKVAVARGGESNT